MRRNLRRLDFAAAAPENIRVRDWDSARMKVPIDCRFVIEEQLFIGAVAHGTDKQLLLDHKAAIDRHLHASAIPVSYTNVFWGGRSEIKPSEISPHVYREWWAQQSKT